MKQLLLIFACFLLGTVTQLQAQALTQGIIDTEKSIVDDLAFAPAESNTSLNNGQMIELTRCEFHGQGLPGSKPKTRVLRYTLWYYGGMTASAQPQPVGGRRVST